MPRKSHQAASSAAGVGAFDTVGFVEGAAVGVEDGAEEGTAVGTVVGTCVGTGTGIGVGCGDTVGAGVGVALGTAVGSAVGRAVGTALGTALGAADGAVVCACATATSNAYRAGRTICSCLCHLPIGLITGQPTTAIDGNATTASNRRRIGYLVQYQMEPLRRADRSLGAGRWAYNALLQWCLRVFQRSGQNVDRPTDVAHCSVGFAGAGLLRRKCAILKDAAPGETAHTTKHNYHGASFSQSGFWSAPRRLIITVVGWPRSRRNCAVTSAACMCGGVSGLISRLIFPSAVLRRP